MARFTKFAVAAVGAALALAGCSGGNSTNSPAADNSLGTITAGKLTLCSDLPYKPFEYEDDSAPSGYAGFDIDIMSAIASKLNLTIVVKQTDFNALQSGAALEAGQCDVGASAITITEERKGGLDFSDPYYDSLQSLLVATSSGITSLADMAGKKIGVQTGTTGEIYANQNAPATATIVSFPSDGEMWPALQGNQVQALLQDFPINNQHVKDDPTYQVVAKYQTNEQYGFALAKGKNPALLAAINTQLQALRDDGTYTTIYNKYFS